MTSKSEKPKVIFTSAEAQKRCSSLAKDYLTNMLKLVVSNLKVGRFGHGRIDLIVLKLSLPLRIELQMPVILFPFRI